MRVVRFLRGRPRHEKANLSSGVLAGVRPELPSATLPFAL